MYYQKIISYESEKKLNLQRKDDHLLSLINAKLDIQIKTNFLETYYNNKFYYSLFFLIECRTFEKRLRNFTIKRE